MEKENNQDKKKKSICFYLFIFGFLVGVFMGGFLVALAVADSLHDVDIAFEKAIEIQKKNNQLVVENAVLSYRLNNSFDSAEIKNLPIDCLFRVLVWDSFSQEYVKTDSYERSSDCYEVVD